MLVLFSDIWDNMTNYYIMPNFLFYFYLFTDLFFFLECLSYSYYMFCLVQYLVYALWTHPCLHTKWSPQYIVDLFSFYFYLFTNLFFVEYLFCPHYIFSYVQCLINLSGHVPVSTPSKVPSMLFVYFLFIFIYLLIFFFSQNVCLTSTTYSLVYNALSTLPGYVPALTSSRVPSMSFVYFIFIFIYLLTFFSFLEYLFYLYYVFLPV